MTVKESVPTVLVEKMFDLQVCVPKDWTDNDVEQFANSRSPAGTQNGWKVMHTGHKYLGGDPERVVCSDNPEYVHMRLEC